PDWLGWRVSLGLGALVGLGMLLARQYVPESPRWLLAHGRREEAERIMESIEAHVPPPEDLPPVTQAMTIYPGTHIGCGTIGRRVMISSSYTLAGVVLVVSEVLFLGNHLTANTQTLLWSVPFFFASAAASAGYLTMSEIFPLEMRALAIALFFAVATAVGGLG